MRDASGGSASLNAITQGFSGIRSRLETLVGCPMHPFWLFGKRSTKTSSTAQSNSDFLRLAYCAVARTLLSASIS